MRDWKKAIGYLPHGIGTIEFYAADWGNGVWYPRGDDSPRRETTWAHLADDPTVVLWDKRQPERPLVVDEESERDARIIASGRYQCSRSEFDAILAEETLAARSGR